MTTRGNYKAPVQLNVFGNVCALYVNGLTTRTLYPNDELLSSDALTQIGKYMPDNLDSEQQRKSLDRSGDRFVGCRLYGGIRSAFTDDQGRTAWRRIGNAVRLHVGTLNRVDNLPRVRAVGASPNVDVAAGIHEHDASIRT